MKSYLMTATPPIWKRSGSARTASFCSALHRLAAAEVMEITAYIG